MSTLLKINIWKKGTNQYTSMPDYQIEIEEGDSYKIGELIDIIKRMCENVEGGRQDNGRPIPKS